MKPVSTTTLAPASVVSRVDPRLVASLAAVYAIWSSTYLAMRIVVKELPPMLMASMRFTVAGVVMLAIARHRGVAWPTRREWLRALPLGFFLFVCGNGFVGIAEQSVSSGGAAVVCATMPLWVGVLGAFGGERPSSREWFSLGLGFVGVVVLMGGPSLDGKPEHIALAIASPICWAIGSVLARRMPSPGALMGPATQMLTGGVLLFVTGAIRGERLPAEASTTSWVALAYLCVFGSLIGFTAYNWLLRNARAVVATSYAYVNPILAVLIAAALYGEPLGPTTIVANVLIVGAVMLALRKPA